MIAVTAGTAPYSIPELSPAGRAAFAEITDEARTALTELRVVLGVLRSPDGQTGPDAAPQPRIADLAGLLSRLASAGTVATMNVSGEVRPLPASVELCCYRIVQEGLTNAGRHAPGSRVLIELCYGIEALSVRVVNEAPAGHRANVRDLAEPGAGPGYGLTGLRERVAMLHGSFRAEPDRGGGFVVSAVLPTPGQPQAATEPG
jgi:signal transduction histidine kinase